MNNYECVDCFCFAVNIVLECTKIWKMYKTAHCQVPYFSTFHAVMYTLCVFYCPPENITFEPWHEISNNLVCATSKGSDQPAHTRRLIRAFAGRLNIL